jgi:hypothetical protein
MWEVHDAPRASTLWAVGDCAGLSGAAPAERPELSSVNSNVIQRQTSVSEDLLL